MPLRYDIDQSSNRACSLVPLALLLTVITVAGCASQKWVSVRQTPKNPLTETLNVFSDKGPKPTERTEQLLRVYNLTDDFHNNPRELLNKLQAIIEREPSIDKLHAFAELSYICGRKAEAHDPKTAIDLYGASALYAYQYFVRQPFCLTVQSIRSAVSRRVRFVQRIAGSGFAAGVRQERLEAW